MGKIAVPPSFFLLCVYSSTPHHVIAAGGQFVPGWGVVFVAAPQGIFF